MKVVITETCKKFIRKLLNDVAELKGHNTRRISQFRIVENPLNKAAVIRMDWPKMQNYFNAGKRKVHITLIYRCQLIRQLCTEPTKALSVLDLFRQHQP